MADLQETQQERETRWAAQRATRDAQQQTFQAARARARGRKGLIGGAIVIIVAVIAAIMLL
jgi:hypothetical protein